ncbi:proteasome 26S non-ATPase subunit 3-like [Planoprotostelium fungivorum]|uniref:Proteasome 26S non-ATPase subunit 3-like n=1 Tax=Planoprotostelium fungivorum TaxID=1890364 RepID=A0A2P6N5W6_9EUKA|nr:proteasome 26S non-ATPase subunit 3-like [Planoprotostelium fungivorum]
MATRDVEMTDANEATKTTEQTNVTKPETTEFLLADLRKHTSLLERAVDNADTRPVSRVLRSLVNTRRKLTPSLLREYISSITVGETAEHTNLRQTLNSQLSLFPTESKAEADVTSMDVGETKEASKEKASRLTPEVEIYARLLIVIYLLDKQKLEEALQASTQLLERFNEKQQAGPRSLDQFNVRTLNPLSAKVFFYYYRTYELSGRAEEIRSKLLALHRTATLRHNDEGAVTLLNLLLRNYLAYNLYEQADKLISRVQFKEEAASNNEYARIKSIQLDYADAYSSLLGAMRKAPQHSAKGFRLAVTKLVVIVQCLIGEIPERSLFRQPGLKTQLVPYLDLVKAVRIGDLNAFHEVIAKYGNTFHSDKTYTLIQRLRHNVIKTGLRKINLSYSRISLEDIRVKLQLDSVEDVEFIAAKAIRDKVINATIDHEGKFLHTKDGSAGYSTDEPQSAFHRRITFCLNTHNDAVKAMRFPPDVHKPTSNETAKERREREQEIAKNLADDEEEEF